MPDNQTPLHYICTGGCRGISSSPGVCQTAGCPLETHPLIPCSCADEKHAALLGLNLNSILLGTQNVQPLVDFYTQVFGRQADWREQGWSGWQIGSCFLTIGKHSQVKGTSTQPQRIIFNFETRQVKEEFARIKKLGAKVVAEPYKMGGGWIATFADPDGNYFQLMSPWKQ